MPRERINTDLPLHQEADAAWQALVDANDKSYPSILVRGNELVRMTERGELEALDSDSVRDELSRVAQFEKEGSDGPRAVDPPRDVANVLLSRDTVRYEGAPRIDRVVDVPVLSSSGELVSEPGCHADAGIYYRPALHHDAAAPRKVETTDDLDWALTILLEELLGDFDFADVSSQAHALALLLLPFVRDRIDGPTPLHVILAPSIGSGKTWVAQAALLPGCGVIPAMSQTRNEEEWRKRITSALLSGTGAVLLDNLSGNLDSGSLASALTTGVWRDRVLGESREVSLPVRNAWVATGNNISLAPEQIRRAIPIFLDPGETTPAERERGAFRHPDLLGWAMHNRAELVSAALTLVQNWLDGPIDHVEGGYLLHRSGEEAKLSGRTMGSFEQWAGVMGGILEAARVPGFLDNRDRLKSEADPETSEDAEFMEKWHEVASGPLEMRKVAELCQFGGELHDHLPSKLISYASTPKFTSQLAIWLREHNRRWVGEFQLLATEGRRREWFIRRKA